MWSLSRWRPPKLATLAKGKAKVKMELDNEWFDASYVDCIAWLNEEGRLDKLREWNWVPQEEFYPLLETRRGLSKRYPKRVLSPILHRLDCDDMLCATNIEGKPNERAVAMIHDFASQGWEGNNLWKSIAEWYEDTKAWQS